MMCNIGVFTPQHNKPVPQKKKKKIASKTRSPPILRPYRQPSGLSRGTPSIRELLAQTNAQVEGESGRGGITAYDSDPSPGAHPTRNSSNLPAWKRLITHSCPPHEITSLVDEIFSNEDGRTVCTLRGDEAQTFVNVIQEVPFSRCRSQGRF